MLSVHYYHWSLHLLHGSILPKECVCVLDCFGEISIGLATVLYLGIPVRRYLYVKKDETATESPHNMLHN